MPFSYLSCSLGMKKLYVQLFEPLLARFALTQLEMDIILFLSNNPEWDTARDIVEMRHLAKSHVSVGIEKLARRGILERFYRDGNRKTIHLRLLPEAEEIVREGQRLQQRYTELLVADFSREEKAQIDTLLDRITRNANRALFHPNGSETEKHNIGGARYE